MRNERRRGNTAIERKISSSQPQHRNPDGDVCICRTAHLNRQTTSRHGRYGNIVGAQYTYTCALCGVATTI